MDDAEFIEPYYDPQRRSATWRTLVTEGVLKEKPVEAFSEEDQNQINARMLLEDIAAKDDINIEQMFADWKSERATAKRFSSVEDFMKDLDAYVASHADQTTPNS